MLAKRLVALVAIVVAFAAAIVVTSPDLVKDVRLGLDLKGGFEILYVAEPFEEGQKVTPEALKDTANSIRDRIDKQGIAEPEITTEGSDRIRVKIAGIVDEGKIREMLKKPAELTFRGPDGTVYLNGTDFVAGGAKVEFIQGTTQPIVTIKLKDEAREKFKRATQELLGQTLAIYLDDELISNPAINEVIDSTSAQITGRFTMAEATDLANTINLGALPLKLTEKYDQTVGATLGQMSLEQTIRAGIIGSIVILLFMIGYYRLPGLIAAFTLIVYTWLLLLVFNLLNATLTLPGIAAFVLGIGIAVDANIITYERIKEEIRSGKSLLSALKAGSRHSFRTIMDANITSILAAVVLYYIGHGAIRGFALITILSIVVSILTNVFLSRLLIYLLIRSNVFTKPGYYGVKEADIREL